MEKTYDFCGWATRNNLRCSDGRVIMRDAFKDCDGMTVPLVWNHQHNDSFNVLGHALLENRDEGVYTYCTLNDTESGKNAKLLVEHGDVSALSIYANQLKQQGSNVLHGAIREVSLVLAGANPGAFIDSIISHGEDMDDEAIIYSGEEISLSHSEPMPIIHAKEKEKDMPDNEETIEDVFNTLSEKQKTAVYAIIGQALEDAGVSMDEEGEAVQHSDDSGEETIKDVFDTLNEKQKEAVYAIIGYALEDAEESVEHSDYEGEVMKHNVFDMEETMEDNVLAHAAVDSIIGDAKRYGSMRDAFLSHSAEYGIETLEWLFPEDRNLNVPPEFISRDMGWVQKVMGSVKHSPFSRVKSMFADITEEQARARGYIKGSLKKEEVFSLLKRSTSPTTIYKKQKMDRDDIVDITDFDVVSWIKGEMRIMLDEEIARAILIGDGRLASDDDHIDDNCIRPVLNDADLFVLRWGVAAGSNDDDKAKNFIRACIKARKDYRGSGNPTLFTTEEMLTNMLLLEDNMGYTLYKTEAELATKLRVKEIVTVEVMEGLKDKDNKSVYGIIVNLADYNVGADKGGAINMFDDFDIDYNQQKYLIETRCSGALIKPFAAIVLRAGSSTDNESPTRAAAMAEFKGSSSDSQSK